MLILSNAKVPDEVEVGLLTVASKKASCVVMVLDAVYRKGLTSTDFREAFDRAQTSLVLAPACEVTWPGYILWARQRLNINDRSGDVPVWVAEIGTSALQKCGISKVDVEQQHFISEVLSTAFKLPDFKNCCKELRVLFTRGHIELLTQHLHVDIFEFAVCLQTILEWDTVLEWADKRVCESPEELQALLEIAVCLFTDAECPSSDLPDTIRYLANLLLGFPKGRRLIMESKHTLETIKQENGKAKMFQEAAQKFTADMDKAFFA